MAAIVPEKYETAKPKRLPLVLLLFLAAGLTASAQPSAGGIIYRPKGTFNLSAPKGWKLDPTAGAAEGLPCVLYLEGATWEKADPLMYAKFAREAIDDMKKNRPGFNIKKSHPARPRAASRISSTSTRPRRPTSVSNESRTCRWFGPWLTSCSRLTTRPLIRNTRGRSRRRSNPCAP